MERRSCTWHHLLLLVSTLACASFVQAGINRVEQTDGSVTYQGTWQTVQGSAVSGGSVAASATANDRASVSFTGTGIAWIGYRCPCAAGIARVYIDDTLHGTVDTYAAGREAQREIYRVSGLTYGAHVLVIEVTGERNSAGESSHVVVDAFDVIDAFDISAPGTQLLQESDPAVSTLSVWEEIDDASVSGGSVIAAQGAGSVTVNFTGTGIAWIGYLCPCAAGIARVYVDGVLASNAVYVESTVRQAQAEIYRVEGLPHGAHTLRIEVTGNTWSNNTWVVVDAFLVTTAVSGTSDAQAPTVTMAAPENGAIVTGVVTISAEATDNVGVSRVQFFAGNVLLGEDTTSPFSITRDTSGIRSDGSVYQDYGGPSYTLYARAYDAAGNVANSPGIVVTVNHEDQIRPTVTLLPAEGATVSGTVTLTANATDDQGVARVMFYRDSIWALDQDETTPYEYVLDTTRRAEGPYFVQAEAVDFDGNSSGKTPVRTLNIDNSVTAERVRVDDTNAAAVYTGSWATIDDVFHRAGRVYHWRSARMSDEIGARVRFTFTGTGVRWLGTQCEECGAADVSIDGGTPTQVIVDGSWYIGEPIQPVSYVVYASPTLPYGTHTLDITVAPYRVGTGQGMNVVIDAFEVLP